MDGQGEIGERLSVEEFNKRYGGGMPEIGVDTTALAPPPDVGEAISAKEFEERYGPTPTTSVVTPEVDSLGEPWERGWANLLKGASDTFFLLDSWAKGVEEATGLERGGLFENVSDWFLDKAEDAYLGAKPATGKYSKPPENLLGYIDVKRVYNAAAENIPLMGAFLVTTLAHPVAGTALMFGVEGGSAARELDKYETETGNRVNPTMKYGIPVIVGAVNAALERVGLGEVMKATKVSGLKGKLLQIAVASLVEGTTEGAQEIMQALGEAGYKGKVPEDTGERFIESLYAGLVLGLTGSSVTAGFGTVGESVVDSKPRKFFESLPEFDNTEDALAYGVTNIKPEEVGLLKQRVDVLGAELQETSVVENLKEPPSEILPTTELLHSYSAEYGVPFKRSRYALDRTTMEDEYTGKRVHPFFVSEELFTDKDFKPGPLDRVARVSIKGANIWSYRNSSDVDKLWSKVQERFKHTPEGREYIALEDIKEGHWETIETSIVVNSLIDLGYKGAIMTEEGFGTTLMSFVRPTEISENVYTLPLTKKLTVSEVELRQRFDTTIAMLSGALGKNAHYDTDKGVVVDDLTDYGFEQFIKSTENDAEAKIAFARSQVDKSEWLRYFSGLGPSPGLPSPNTGAEINNDMLSETDKIGRTDEELRQIDYKKPRHIHWVARRLLFPEFLLKKRDKPLKNSSEVLEGELYLNHTMMDYASWTRKLKHRLSPDERKQVRKAMELMYLIKDPNTSLPGVAKAKQDLIDLYTKYPRTQRAIDGIDKHGGVIDLFEYIKTRYKDMLRETKRNKFSAAENKILDETLVALNRGDVPDVTTAAQNSVNTHLDIEAISRKEIDKKHGEGSWSVLSDKKKEVKRNRVIEREGRRFLRDAKEIKDVEKWGLRDYITNIELGSYRILDVEGNTLGFGRTAREAKKKAFEIRKELKERGEVLPKLTVEASFSPINPTVKREDVLAGMEDIFEALPKYVYAMEKRIIMEPIIQRYKQAAKENPREYGADVRDIIQNQINYVMGAKYSWGDMIADDIATHYGWKTGKYSLGVRKVRSAVAKLKLGYRVVAAAVNALGGFGNTWVAVGNHFFAAGRKAIKEGKYEAPDGEVVDMNAKLKEVEDKGLLGIDFAVGASGDINPRVPIWKPLGLFQLPEKFIRPHNFASNYIYQREVLGKNDFEATEAAKINLRFQQITYNLAAIPHILRSPTARVVGQFKTYLVGILQFMSTLRGKQIARMVGLQLMMAGPRGAVYMLKSIPILGALGLLDDAEEWLVRKKGTFADLATRGIGGLIGADISAPATFQLPGRAEDWGGPFLGDMVRLFKDVIIPAIESVGVGPKKAYIEDDVINWVAALSPLMYYLKDFEQSVMVWEDVKSGDFKKAWLDLTRNLQKPNVWIRDSAGNKAYKIGGLQDRLLLLAGAPPTDKTQYQVLKSLWRRDEKVRKENRIRWYNKVTKKLIRGEPIGEALWSDAILYRVDPTQIPSSLMFKELSPRERETLRARLLEKAEAIDHFGIE